MNGLKNLWYSVKMVYYALAAWLIEFKLSLSYEARRQRFGDQFCRNARRIISGERSS